MSLPNWDQIQAGIEQLIAGILSHVSTLSGQLPHELEVYLAAAEAQLAEQLGQLAGTALHDALSAAVKAAVTSQFNGPNTFDPTVTG